MKQAHTPFLSESVFAMRPFLTAQWHDLIVVNYEVDPRMLEAYLPEGTELDLWKGEAIVSLVAFRFSQTRVLGLAIPFHKNFEEVNLRFYVKRMDQGDLKRGVVFIKELVPKRAIAAVARWVYAENYVCVPMCHTVELNGETREISYRWKSGAADHGVSASLVGSPKELTADSEAEFILEHYWGYTKRTRARTIEYHVTHPSWRFWDPAHVDVQVDFASTYGSNWAKALSGRWRSAFVAEGSEVFVFAGRRLDRGH